MTTAQTQPAPVSDRAGILDVLRGIAILGIFLNNIFGFTGYGGINEKFKASLPTYPADSILSFLQTVFVEGKFYSLFSLLFGIGFSIILINNQQKGINGLRIFYRRLAILVMIGAIHLLLFWDGDILLLYGIIGMVLPLFRNCSDKTLLKWAVCLILSPILIDIIEILLQWTPGELLRPFAFAIDAKNALPDDENTAFYLYKAGSGWHEFKVWQEPAFFYRYAYLLDNDRIPKVLGMFLIGFVAGRKMMFKNLTEYKPLFKKLLLWGFVIGLPASFSLAWFERDGRDVYKSWWGMMDTIFYAISVVPLSLAYVSGICLYWIKTKGQNPLKIIAPVGRMALTNYLTQTIVSIFIFYGVGLGLGLKFGPTYFIPMAFGIYILQVIISNVWFKYFQYGPVEWIWRQLTYGKRLPFKKTVQNKINQ